MIFQKHAFAGGLRGGRCGAETGASAGRKSCRTDCPARDVRKSETVSNFAVRFVPAAGRPSHANQNFIRYEYD